MSCNLICFINTYIHTLLYTYISVSVQGIGQGLWEIFLHHFCGSWNVPTLRRDRGIHLSGRFVVVVVNISINIYPNDIIRSINY